jgi:hypothetical protein
MNNFYKNELNRREKRVKQYLIATLVITSLSSIPDFIVGMFDVVKITTLSSPLLLIAFYIRKNNSDLAGTLLLVFITLIIFFSNFYYGTSVNASFFYIAEYIILLLVIDNRNKFYLILNNILIVGSILITQLVNFKPLPINESSIQLMSIVNVVMSIVASIFLFYTYIVENIEKENYLLTMHKRINIKNKIIENAQTNLETFIYRSSHNLQGPIRSIMGLYNLSILEQDSKKLKELIQLVNESATQLDKELSVTSQVFKINQHEITLSPINLWEFVEDFYQTTTIKTDIDNKKAFDTQADVTLLTEGMKNLYAIYSKMRKNDTTIPQLSMSINGFAFMFTLAFESKNLDDKYLDNFFAPYQKDMGYLFNLTSEPYMCRRIMDKLHGNVTIEKIKDNIIAFTVTSTMV